MLVGLLGIFEFSFSSLKFLTPSVWTIYSICKSTGGTYRTAGRLNVSVTAKIVLLQDM